MADRPLPGVPQPAKKKRGGARPGGGRPKQERCKRGHSLVDPANVYIDKHGYPHCLACHRKLNKESAERVRNRLRQERQSATQE